MLSEAMSLQGLSMEQARSQIWLFNRGGLVESARHDLADYQREYAHQHVAINDFVHAIESIKPTALIGVSTLAKGFSQPVIESMARINRRPIIFALSNPTSRSECTAEEAYRWSDGRAIFASGSPFSPVRYHERTLMPGQCNNVYIFPAMGLAAYATRAKRITGEMFMAAAHGVAEQVSAAEVAAGLIYPPQSALLKTEVHAAKRIAEVVFARGLAQVERPNDLDAFVDSHVYAPQYQRLI